MGQGSRRVQMNDNGIEMPAKKKECPYHWLPCDDGQDIFCLGCVARTDPALVRKLRGIIPIIKISELEEKP
jgi:hypothetical protein